jgi:hypothetical protein
MTEIIARISANAGVELIGDQSKLIDAVGSLSPMDAAYLARGIFSCAAMLSGANPPKAGVLVSDVHIPPLAWRVGISRLAGDPVLILSVPPGIELTFLLPAEHARKIAGALIAQADGVSPPEGQRGMLQ